MMNNSILVPSYKLVDIKTAEQNYKDLRDWYWSCNYKLLNKIIFNNEDCPLDEYHFDPDFEEAL